MVVRLPVLAGLVVATLLSAIPAYAQAVELGVKQTQRTPAIRTGEVASFSLAAHKGDYFRGTAEVRVGRFNLDLVGPDGRHLRRLASEAVGTAEFQFVAESNGLTLHATAIDAGDIALTISTRLSPAGQVASPDSYVSPAIAALARQVEAGGTTEPFWVDVTAKGTPLVEPGPNGQAIVTFLARGARRNVRLFGAPSGDHESLERLGASDVWFKSFIVPTSTRLSYQLAPDVPDLPGSARDRRVAILATARADPLNRTPWPADAPDAFNQDSVLELPDAPVQPGLIERGAPKGTLSEFRIASERLGNERTITLYRPAGFDPANPDNVLLFVFDAKQYLTRVPTPTILDNLIAERRLPPVVAVFVSEIDRQTRARELPGNSAFADFMALELLPRVRRETGATIPTKRTALTGSSYGGLAAATVALAHPEAFGNAISLSGSFWWHPEGSAEDQSEHVAAWVARNRRADVRFHLMAGLFETGRVGSPGIVDTSRHLRDVLAARGYAVTYREYAGGHDYLVWRGALADALVEMWE
ncbi:MAG TPA: enterochelin esterase [Ancylobacter sp.]